MAKIPRGRTDRFIDQIMGALKRYEVDHPRAEIELYRQNPASIRVRIIDPDFRGLNRIARHSEVWRYLDPLPEDALAEINTLILITQDETKTSLSNLEFDDPLPSMF